MPHYDGPFKVTGINPQASTLTVQWPINSQLFLSFHISHTKPYQGNDDRQYPQ